MSNVVDRSCDVLVGLGILVLLECAECVAKYKVVCGCEYFNMDFEVLAFGS